MYQKKKDVILRTRDEETWRLPGEGDYARNSSWNTDKRKTKEEVDGQHERMDGIINRGTDESYRRQERMEKNCLQCDQSSCLGRLKTRQDNKSDTVPRF